MSRLGQLIITGIRGLVLEDDEVKFISEENVGGVILFQNNYESPAQLAELINSIQQLRDEYPLFIAADHEGGRVQRFKSGFSHFPPMLEVAKHIPPKTIFDMASIMAAELKACGVNLALSPVCDILNNPSNKVIGDRAFGTDAETVSKNVSSIIRGFQKNDVLACAKHFPGHGNTFKDSHFDLPIVKKSLDELRNEEFIPFIKAAKARVEFIMMAHLLVDSIDEKLPCTLSPNAYKLIREELKFKKIIISDDMQMKAIMDNYSVPEAAVMAINAGADIVEYRDMELAKEALKGLKEAYAQKTISTNVLNDRYERILKCKIQNLKGYTPTYIPDIRKVVGSTKHLDFFKNIQEMLPTEKVS